MCLAYYVVHMVTGPNESQVGYKYIAVSAVLMQEASASITGDGVYGKLKFESGVHRVQV